MSQLCVRSSTIAAISFDRDNVELGTDQVFQALAAKGGPPIYKFSIEEARMTRAA